MDTQKLISAVVGGIVAGFSIGVGFMIAQKTVGGMSKKRKGDEVSEAIKEGVKEGVKQAKIEEDAAAFAAANAGKRRRAPQGGRYMGFDGQPENPMSELGLTGLGFNQTPNSHLNGF